jgi:cold shock CspA family protein
MVLHFQLSSEKVLNVNANRECGKVRLPRENRGYCFLIPDSGGEDAFAHYNEFLRAQLAEPENGARCSYRVEESARGPRPVDIVALD